MTNFLNIEFTKSFKVQYKPLNVITLWHNKSDNINQMMTTTDEISSLIFSKWELKMWSH